MKKNYKIFPGSKWLRDGAKAGFSLLIAALASANLQAQNSYTFTNTGLTGPVGPTQTQINAAYLSTNLNGSVVSTSGIQTFTIPLSGPYRITAVGAQGGYNGGRGASISGDFTLTAGTVLKILVGQQGTTGTNGAPYTAGGGGGGSYVTSLANSPYVVAGGGGGNGDGYTGVPVVCCLNGMEASLTPSGNPHPSGTNGGTGLNGGTCPSYGAGAGAGFNGDGSLCYAGSVALSYTNGGTGGNGFAYAGTLANGGFGGGGGHADSGTGMRGGGGGGYSGGGGGAANSGNDAAGGGGGSFNAGANQTNSISTNTGGGRVTIDLLCNISLTSSGSNSISPSICSGSSVTLTTNAASNYTWSTNNSSTTSIVVTPGATTTYSIIGTSSANCVASAFITVTVSSGFPTLSISNPSNNICLGKTVSLTASGALTYTWVNPGVANGQTFSPSSTAIYTVNGQNGCGISTQTTSIIVAPLAISTLASPTTVCQGYTTSLLAISAVSNYTWQPSGLSGANVVVAPYSNTIYTVTATDGTCSGTQTVAVTTIVTPTITAATSATRICEGDVVTLTGNGAGVNGNYSWSPGSGTGATFNVSPSQSTLFTVTGTNALGCTSSAQLGVVVDNAPSVTVSAVSNKTLICSGATTTLQATGANTYSWTGGPVSALYPITQTAALATYTVMAGHSLNTCVASRTISVAAIVPNVVVTTSVGICTGASAQLVASGANTYAWNGLPASANGTFNTSPSATIVYSVIATTTSLTVNCPVTRTAQVVVYTNPTLSVVPTRTAICKGETNTLTASGAGNYSWAPTGSGNTITINPTSSSFYTVTGTDVHGCAGTTVVQAKVNTCAGLLELSDNNGVVSVFPNPASSEITISSKTNVELRLVNELGQVIREVSLQGGVQQLLNVKELSNGIYFFVGENQDGKINQKVIIAK